VINTDEPRLYVLARNDLTSMNAGKLAAQVGHATSLFHERMFERQLEEMAKTRAREEAEQRGAPSSPVEPDRALAEYFVWKTQAGRCGTQIVLAATPRQMELVLMLAEQLPDHIALSGRWVDPTYPVRDGEVTHLVPLLTTAYVFCSAVVARALLGHLPLYP